MARAIVRLPNGKRAIVRLPEEQPDIISEPEESFASKVGKTAVEFAPEIGQIAGGLAATPIAAAGQAVGIPVPATIATGEAVGRGSGKFLQQFAKRPSPEALKQPVTAPFGGIAPGLPLLETLGRGIASRTPEERSEIAAEAGLGAGTSLAFGGGLFALGKVKNFFTKSIGQVLQGQPKNLTRILVERPEEIASIRRVISGSKDLLEQGVANTKESIVKGLAKVSKARNTIEERLIRKTGNFKGAKVIPVKEIKESFQAMLSKLGVGVEGAKKAISPADERKLLNVLKEFDDDSLSLANAINLRRKIDDLVSFNNNLVKKIGGTSEGVLKNVSGRLRNNISDTFPSLKEVNARFSELRSVYDDIAGKLTDVNAEKNLVRFITNDTAEAGLLKRLNEKLPKTLKFYKDLENAVASSRFSELLPRGIFGRVATVGALGTGVATGDPKTLALGTLGLGAFSPAGLAIGTKAAGSVIKGLAAPGVRQAGSATVPRFIDRLRK